LFTAPQEALNVFYYLTYEGAVDLDKLEPWQREVYVYTYAYRYICRYISVSRYLETEIGIERIDKS